MDRGHALLSNSWPMMPRSSWERYKLSDFDLTIEGASFCLFHSTGACFTKTFKKGLLLFLSQTEARQTFYSYTIQKQY